MSDSIPFASIDPGIRARTQHLNLEELADSISDSGLIQPIVLVLKTPTLVSAYESEYQTSLDPSRPYLLTAGGRRHAALELLETPSLYHGSTSDPQRPGFLLRGEAPLIDQLILEAKENQNRDDIDWRDQMKLNVRAWRLAKREADERGQALSQAVFGVSLGTNSAAMYIGEKIYDHFLAQPEKYADVTSHIQALGVFTKSLADEVTRVAVAKSMGTPVSPTSQDQLRIPSRVCDALAPGHSPALSQTLSSHVIPLSQSFLNTDGIAFMETASGPFCDHIICDPDYAIDGSVLNSHPNNRPGIMADGIQQKSASDSLADLYRFIGLSYRCLSEHGFLIFWYALDHHEKLQRVCEAAGFRVQGWPLVWNKIDFRGRSNSAPNQNWPKSVEYAMVCRKPGTVLAKVQTSCVFTTEEQAVTKKLGHAYAKPMDLWRWIFAAVSVPGQVVFDPFVGSGSSAIAAIRYGLRPIGCEIVPEIYNKLIINLQNEYRSLLKNPNVRFA